MKSFFATLLLVCAVATSAYANVVANVFASVAKPNCGGSTSSKDVQLLKPTNPPRECVYHINAYSSYVCQLRIDFAMTLAQPSVPAADNRLSYAECVDDYFEVAGMRLCGVETNQHIYVPFNRTAGVTKIDLAIVLAARVGGYSGLPTPSWDMKITQLECPAGASIRSLEPAAMPMRPEARATIKDGFFVAPPGCLQYFPQSAGVVNSFNYNNGRGIYPGQINYAICFRRTTHTQALELQSHFFKLGAEYDNPELEMDSYCYPQSRSARISEDYLLVPQATILQDNIRATYFCGNSIQGDTLRSTNPGPLSIIFNSDGIYKVEREMGFSFSYRVL